MELFLTVWKDEETTEVGERAWKPIVVHMVHIVSTSLITGEWLRTRISLLTNRVTFC